MGSSRKSSTCICNLLLGTLFICIFFCNAMDGDTDRFAFKHFKHLKQIFKRRTAVDLNAISDNNEHEFSSRLVIDNLNPVSNCMCTYDEAVNQLSCNNLMSSVALANYLNSPQTWCNLTIDRIASGNNSLAEYRNDVRRVSIAHSFLANFTFDLLKRFNSLNVLKLSRNNFGDSSGPLVIDGFQLTTLVELDLSDNDNFTQLKHGFMTTFPRLQTLRLDWNNLTKLENKLFSIDIVPDLKIISLKGNQWRCQEIAWFIDWLRFKASIILEDSSQTKCQSCEVRQQITCFLMITWDNFIERCPHNCTCFMMRANVAVDCRNRGYTDFPAIVPHDVGVLYMQNNSVRSLHTLKNASSGYQNIRYLYLDNNAIDSINGLDGTNFEDLTTLHMNGNRLSQLSVHVFEKLFSRNLDEVKLGNNPWNCECNTVVPFNDLLNSRLKRFKDIEQILCSSNSTLHPNQPIHRLSASDFCSQTSSIHPLDIINVILASLILIITSKLLYDYRAFKRTGQIPSCPLVNVCNRKPN